MSHLVLQVYLGPTGEKKLYHISTTTLTGTHEDSELMLRNTMTINVNVINMKMKEGSS